MAPPSRLSTMPGEFDFPPASDPSLQRTRSTEGEERLAHEPHMIATIQAAERSRRGNIDFQSTTGIPENRRRRARIRAIQTEEMRRLEAVGHSTSNVASLVDTHPSTSVVRLRPQANPSERFLQRNRSRRQHEGNALSDSIDTVQQAVERLNEASSNLSSLLDEPIPRIVSPGVLDRDYPGIVDNIRRRVKRRKLDGAQHENGFKYGYHGQVVPAPLKMEIVSCDGGHFTEYNGNVKHSLDYWPENVLRNDKSVYCTENSKCNIILCHRGEIPFSLKKLIVKAPERGFPAPIQEGLIFISMTSNDLLDRTTQYRLREPTPPPLPNSSTVLDDTDEPPRAPTSQTTVYPEIYTHNHNDRRPPSRRADHSAIGSIRGPMSSTRVSADQPIRSSSGSLPAEPLAPSALIDGGDGSAPHPRTVNPSLPPLFNVTIDCDDQSGDEEEVSSAAILADRYRRDHLPLIYSSSDDEGDGGLGRWVGRRPGGPDLSTARNRRCRRRVTPSKVELNVLADAKEGEPSAGGKLEVLAPHARFFIEREKSMVSIKFDPPVCGRFILFKLWSPAKDQNIDIQSIVAHGFAGPRFFPAIKMM